jgi:filamentous hemagglutinin
MSRAPDRPPAALSKLGNFDETRDARRGTVDAGDAGIRVSGNLSIVALAVANADNIQVKGTITGIATAPQVNIGALTTASNAAGAAAEAAQATRVSSRTTQDLPSIITVEVIGYGGGDGTPAQQPQNDQRQKKPIQQSSYDPNGMFRVVGHGALNEDQKRALNDNERRGLSEP